MTQDTATVLVAVTTRCPTRPATSRNRARGDCGRHRPRRRPDQAGESGVRAVTEDGVTEVDDGRRATRDRSRRHRASSRSRPTPSAETERGAAVGHRRPRRPADATPAGARRVGDPAARLGRAGLLALLRASSGPTSRPTPPRPRDASRRRSDGAVALLSYAPEHHGQGLRHRQVAPDRRLPGLLQQFTHDIVTPAVKQKSVKTSAVDRAVGGRRPAARLRRWCWCSSTRRPPARRIPTGRSPRAASRSD